MVGAVLLALASPGLRGSGRGEDGGGSSQQGSSSVGQHVVMLHNRTIWIANGVVQWENDGQRRCACFLGWTPDRDSQFDDELMRVEAQSRFGRSVGSTAVKGFKGVGECGRSWSGRFEIESSSAG